MGWNDSDQSGQKSDRDNWNDRRNSDGPPDLEQMLRNMMRKLKGAAGAGRSQSPIGGGTLVALVSVIAIIGLGIWAASGFFLVQPAEQAVVLRLGKYTKTLGPGPHWVPRFIDSTYVVNTQAISTFRYDAQMLTKDKNIVSVGIAIKYRVDNPSDYLFNVVNPIESLRQATASVLRQVIGNRKLQEILTYGRHENTAVIKARLDRKIEKLLATALANYKPGLLVTDATIQHVKPPSEVISAFDDAIRASEDKVRYERVAQANAKKYVIEADGHARRMMQEARATKRNIVAQAQAAVASYLALLPQYHLTPKLIRQRLYLDTLQSVLAHSSKILLAAEGSNNVMYLPLDKILRTQGDKAARVTFTEPQTHVTITRRDSGEKTSRFNKSREDYTGRGN